MGEDGVSCYAYDHESTRKSFSELWESFLSLRMEVDVYKRALLMLDDRVMPHLTRPLLLTDFLVRRKRLSCALSDLVRATLLYT